MFEDDEALDGSEGASEAATNRSGFAVVAHPQHPADRGPAPVVHPPAYRGVVAGWPEDWRERWGRRANELEEAGLSWRDAEAQAFVETWNLVRQGRRAGVIAAASPDPERN
jgi:hypothetical protein